MQSSVELLPVPWCCGTCAAHNPGGTRFCGQCGSPGGPRAATGPERRLVTALFADVSGFTALADRLDSDALHEIVAPLIRGLAVIAESYEGTVAKYAGDAILVFFGAPTAREDDAQRALEVALAMHARLPELTRGLSDLAGGLSLHIGVNTGRVIADAFGGDVAADYSILGDAVNVAQRLESVAPPGDTYVGFDTVELTRDRFRYESVPAMRLRNKPEPVPVWRLVGRRRAAVQRGHALVGRGDELVTARAALAGGRPVALVGEPGVGKTALLESLVGGAPFRRLATACLSYGNGIPYWPFVDLLRRERGETSLSPALAAFADGRGTAGLDLTPEAFQRVAHADYVAWVRGLADDVLLTLEDLQWADAGSHLLVQDLLAAGIPAILTMRPGQPPPPGCEVVRLGPLGERAAVALLSDLLGGPPPPALVDVATERADGNPLFIRELVRSLQQRGALRRSDGSWRLAPGWDASALPVTIERVLAGRVDALSRPAAATLSSAAVIGRRVPLSLLRAVCHERVDESVEELLDAEFLEPDGEDRVRFTHALVQDVAYGRLPRQRRRELHERVADAGEAIYGDGDDVIELAARHRYLGAGGPRAISALQRAATRARRLHALDQVALHLGRATELLRAERARTDELLDMCLELACVQELRGEYAPAAAGYGEVRDRRGDVAAWRGLASTARRRGDYDEALATAEAALAELDPGGDDAAPLLLERGWTLSLLGRWREAREALTSGLEAAGGSEGPVTGHLLVQLARVRSLTGDHEGAIADASRAGELFERLGDSAGGATAARVLGGAYADAGQLDAAAETTQTAILLAERSGTVEEVAGALLNAAVVALRRGELNEAIDLNQRAIREFERLAHGSGRAVGYGNLADTLLAAGRHVEAIEWSRRALSVAALIGHVETMADAGWTLARALRATGDVEAARAAATSAAAYFDAIGEYETADECRRLDAVPS
ncbi:MAG: tetratricopeptide repeat protein [Actinobacteria bacterium]|nr:tetratricopeptide repeat protein [Actinomycetota bacterium]